MKKKKKRPQITNGGQDVGKGNRHMLLVGMSTDTGTVENSMEILKKLKPELKYDPAIPLLGIYSKGNTNSNLKRYMYPNVQSSILYNN